MDDRTYANNMHNVRRLLIPPELQALVQPHRSAPTRHRWVRVSGPRLRGFECLTTIKIARHLDMKILRQQGLLRVPDRPLRLKEAKVYGLLVRHWANICPKVKPVDVLQVLGYDGISVGTIGQKTMLLLAIKDLTPPHHIRIIGESMIQQIIRVSR